LKGFDADILGGDHRPRPLLLKDVSAGMKGRKRLLPAEREIEGGAEAETNGDDHGTKVSALGKIVKNYFETGDQRSLHSNPPVEHFGQQSNCSFGCTSFSPC
jgi:hypothetical protein